MKNYDIAAYIWPAYTGDEPRTRIFWEEGIGEWQTVKKATAKFPEHNWPRKPLWGYQNEADPAVMEHQIEQAASHGVNVFIYDWYWYDKRPFLEGCLNDGYLKASNNDKVKFYLMWANHDANHTWDLRNSNNPDPSIWLGSVDRVQFDEVCDRLIEKYFHLPNYYTIDGKPLFAIYDIANLISGLGGVENTKNALESLRQKAIASGLDGVHIQLIQWGEQTHNLSGVDSGAAMTTNELATELGFDSITHYQFVHFTNIDRDYREIAIDVVNEWDKIDKLYDIPYFPHVSVGWDNNPRFTEFRGGIVKNNTPENVKELLKKAKEYVDSHPKQPPLVTINSWNEWTETSYLQPDDLYGYGYLEAIRDVFVEKQRNTK